MPQDFLLMNLENHIDNLHLYKKSTLNVNDAHAVTVDHYERDAGAKVKIADEVSKDDANKMLDQMIDGNEEKLKEIEHDFIENGGNWDEDDYDDMKETLEQG